MTPKLRILGEHPLAKDGQGRLKSRIATVFPFGNTLVTLPGIHATQRLAYVEVLNRERPKPARSRSAAAEFTEVWSQAVDLIMEDDAILIRPDPDNMPLAFKGRRGAAGAGAEAPDQVPLRAQREGPRGDQAAGRVLADQPAAQVGRRNAGHDRRLADRHRRRRDLLLQQGHAARAS